MSVREIFKRANVARLRIFNFNRNLYTTENKHNADITATINNHKKNI